MIPWLRMRKECSVYTNGEAIRLLRAAGIHILLDFIMFDPEHMFKRFVGQCRISA